MFDGWYSADEQRACFCFVVAGNGELTGCNSVSGSFFVFGYDSEVVWTCMCVILLESVCACVGVINACERFHGLRRIAIYPYRVP